MAIRWKKTLAGTVITVRRKCKTMNEEEPINEYKEPQMLTKEFCEDLARRGRENIIKLDKALRDLYEELGIPNEDQ